MNDSSLAASAFDWSLALAKDEIESDYRRLRSIPSLSIETLFAVLQSTTPQDCEWILTALVRQQHEVAARDRNLALSTEDFERLGRFQEQRHSHFTFTPQKGLNKRAFGKSVDRAFRRPDAALELQSPRLLCVRKTTGDWIITTKIGIQAKPFYLQDAANKSDGRMLTGFSFLRTLGISGQTAFDKASLGTEDEIASSIFELAELLVSFLESIGTD